MKETHRFSVSKKFIALILCIAVILGIIAADFFLNMQKSEKTYIAMGTVVTTRISGRYSSDAEKEIRQMIDGIETSELSWRKEGSDVYRINEMNGEFASVSKDTAQCIDDCVDISEKSKGAFDITVGKVTQLWNFDGESDRVPQKKDIENALSFVDYSRLMFNSTAVKCAEGQFIDLGAVGKGFACDKSKTVLDDFGIKSAIISVGGSVLVYGRKATVGIVNPDNDTDYMGTVQIKNQCISTSGDYERFFVKDGKKYHHIIDPSTGYPVENNLRSVTVICDSGTKSDALSTACFVLGYKGALGLLTQCNAQAVFIFEDKTVAVTEGLKNNFKITDSNFKMK